MSSSDRASDSSPDAGGRSCCCRAARPAKAANRRRSPACRGTPSHLATSASPGVTTNSCVPSAVDRLMVDHFLGSSSPQQQAPHCQSEHERSTVTYRHRVEDFGCATGCAPKRWWTAWVDEPLEAGCVASVLVDGLVVLERTSCKR